MNTLPPHPNHRASHDNGPVTPTHVAAPAGNHNDARIENYNFKRHRRNGTQPRRLDPFTFSSTRGGGGDGREARREGSNSNGAASARGRAMRAGVLAMKDEDPL